MRMKQAQQGFSLVELLIALTVSLIMVLALVLMYSNSSRTKREIDRNQNQVESGQFALQSLRDDLLHAGFYGRFNPQASQLPTPAVLPDPCLTDFDSIAASLAVAVQGYDNSAGLGCLNDVRAGEDIFVIRRVATCAIGEPDCDLVPNALYFQASECNDDAELASPEVESHYRLHRDLALLDRTQRDCVTLATIRRVIVHIYYIANNDIPGDGIPTLYRAALGAGGFEYEPIAPGVEAMQIEYGIDDLDGAGLPGTDGLPDFYTADPSTARLCTPAECMAQWENVTALQLNLLIRNESKSNDYIDKKTFTLGNDAGGNVIQLPPRNDEYRRRVYRTQIRLANRAIRRDR